MNPNRGASFIAVSSSRSSGDRCPHPFNAHNCYGHLECIFGWSCFALGPPPGSRAGGPCGRGRTSPGWRAGGLLEAHADRVPLPLAGLLIREQPQGLHPRQAGHLEPALAVIVVMPPRDRRDDDRPGAPLTFKVSLTTDAQTATIEMDGHPAGTTSVQRFYAAEVASHAPARGTTSSRSGVGRAASPWATPVGPGSGSPAAEPVPVDDSRRAALPTATQTAGRPYSGRVVPSQREGRIWSSVMRAAIPPSHGLRR
jgi:hypothetical protein